jgi:protein YibB
MENLVDYPRNKVTIVTAFKDLGREKWSGERNGRKIPNYIARTREQYFERFYTLCENVNNDIIVYMDSKYIDEVKNKNYKNVTIINIDTILESHLANTIRNKISKIQRNSNFIEFVDNPQFPEYWDADYVLINMLKSNFVSLSTKYIKTDVAAWVDFGYARDKELFERNKGKTFVFDTRGKINLFLNKQLTDEPLFSIIKSGEVFIRGCIIIGPTLLFNCMDVAMIESCKVMTDLGLIDDDQTGLLFAYRTYSSMFYLNEGKQNWFEDVCDNMV